MEALFGSGKPVEEIPVVKQKDILKEGWLDKQSRYMKSWRK